MKTNGEKLTWEKLPHTDGWLSCEFSYTISSPESITTLLSSTIAGLLGPIPRRKPAGRGEVRLHPGRQVQGPARSR